MQRNVLLKHGEQWEVNLDAGVIKHASGLKIVFTALPDAGHFQGSPCEVPSEMTARTLSRLIRRGFDEFRISFAQRSAERVVLVLKMH